MILLINNFKCGLRLHKKLQKLFTTLENERIILSNEIKKLPPDKLNRIPVEGKWSVIQIIFHLVKTEKIISISIQKHLRDKEKINAAGLNAFARTNLLMLALKSPLKFKAPPIVAKVPDTYNIDDLLAQWEKVRRSLEEILKNISPELLKINIFHHYYAGRMNVVQTLRFALEHFKNHKKQINKIISKK